MKFLAITALSARHALHERGEALARTVFYLAILLVFSRLWQVLDAGGRLGGVGAAPYLWYVALTEWALLAMPLLYLDIEEDIRRGDIAYRIARPVSYLWTKYAEGLGAGFVKLVLMGGVGGAAAWILTGTPPPKGLLLSLPLGTLALFNLMLWQTAIGLSAFWLGDAAPFFWIWQKTLFVLGGLMFPLEVYPHWLQRAAYFTPFAPLLHGWARLAFGFDLALAGRMALLLVAWGVAMVAFVAWLYRRALIVLDVNGG
jgi:ABC-2 type transport system permease protein